MLPLIKVERTPHGLNWTHASQPSPELVHFRG